MGRHSNYPSRKLQIDGLDGKKKSSGVTRRKLETTPKKTQGSSRAAQNRSSVQSRQSTAREAAPSSRANVSNGRASQPSATGRTRRVQAPQNGSSRTQQAGATRRSAQTGAIQRVSQNKPAQARTQAAAGGNGQGGRTSTAADAAKVKKIKRIAIAVVAVLLVLTCIDCISMFNKIHPGVSVQGVEVGGKTVAQASRILDETLTEEISAKEFVLNATSDGADDLHMTLDAKGVGAYIDGDALAQEAYEVGRSGNVVLDRLDAWFGGHDVAGYVSCKEDSFNALVAKVNDSVGTAIKDSKITLRGGEFVAKEGHDGVMVKESALSKQITKALFGETGSSFEVKMSVHQMRITKATAEKVAKQANDAIAKGITLTYKKHTWNLGADELNGLLSQKVFEPGQALAISRNKAKVVELAEGETSQYDVTAGTDSDSKWVLQAYVNQKKAKQYLADLLGKKAKGDAVDAKFDVSSGEVKIIESKNGSGPDRATAAVEMQDILFGTAASNAITLNDITIEPDVTTEDAKGMGIKEKLATFSISYAGSTSARINNIELLCSMIDGSLVAPGDVWSFNDTTGERTAEKGFQEAAAIVGGKHEDQLGGGVCCVASTVFNAVCLAGLGIQERSNHSFYIATYDDRGVADATVSYPNPDFKWLNDYKSYVLMSVTANGSEVTVSLWGTGDDRVVTIDRGEWKKGDKYKTVKEKDPELPKGTKQVTQQGQDGRSIVIHYYVTSKTGEVLHDIEFKSVYSAQNEIISIGTKTSETQSADTSEESENDGE